MKKIDFGQTVTILANVGVIAGIVFLALEVRQNQETLERGNAMNLVAVQTTSQAIYSDFRYLLLDNDELFSIWQRGLADEELTESEQAKFMALCNDQIWRMATDFRTWDALDQPLDAQNAIMAVRGLRARSESYDDCWEQVRAVAERIGYRGFIEGVDEN
jgi:hypothetical protein